MQIAGINSVKYDIYVELIYQSLTKAGVAMANLIMTCVLWRKKTKSSKAMFSENKRIHSSVVTNEKNCKGTEFLPQTF